MNRTGLIRFGGLAAMVGGALFVAAPLTVWLLVSRWGLVLDDERYLAPIYALLPLVALAALASIEALYVREGERRLWLATIAFLVSLAGVGMMLYYALAVLPGLGLPTTDGLLLLGASLATLGLLALGFLTIHGRVLPWWCGVALVAGSPPFAFLGPLWGAVLLGGAWAVVGYAIFRAAVHQAEQPSRVR